MYFSTCMLEPVGLTTYAMGVGNFLSTSNICQHSGSWWKKNILPLYHKCYFLPKCPPLPAPPRSCPLFSRLRFARRSPKHLFVTQRGSCQHPGPPLWAGDVAISLVRISPFALGSSSPQPSLGCFLLFASSSIPCETTPTSCLLPTPSCTSLCALPNHPLTPPLCSSAVLLTLPVATILPISALWPGW